MKDTDLEFELITDEWRIIHEFPEYSVSQNGHVMNNRTGRLMARTLNQQGIVQVGFSQHGTYYKRSLALLVAHAFLPRPFGPFDTPINVDGDRTNNAADNLMWRPRWFAVAYHRQFRARYKNPINQPIIEVKTQDVCRNSFEASVKYGLLESDLVLSILNRTVVWPTYQEFRILA